jgi:hypothetical protein
MEILTILNTILLVVIAIAVSVIAVNMGIMHADIVTEIDDAKTEVNNKLNAFIKVFGSESKHIQNKDKE